MGIRSDSPDLVPLSSPFLSRASSWQTRAPDMAGPRSGALPWHQDPFHRISVVLSGDPIRIEFRDDSETLRVPVKRGQVAWEEPLKK